MPTAAHQIAAAKLPPELFRHELDRWRTGGGGPGALVVRLRRLIGDTDLQQRALAAHHPPVTDWFALRHDYQRELAAATPPALPPVRPPPVPVAATHCQQTWAAALDNLAQVVPRAEFATWLLDTSLASLADGCAIVVAGSEMQQQVLRDRYGSAVRSALVAVTGRIVNVEFQTGGSNVETARCATG